MANPEHVERLTHKVHLIEFVGEFSHFRQRVRQTDQQSARWVRRKHEN